MIILLYDLLHKNLNNFAFFKSDIIIARDDQINLNIMKNNKIYIKKDDIIIDYDTNTPITLDEIKKLRIPDIQFINMSYPLTLRHRLKFNKNQYVPINYGEFLNRPENIIIHYDDLISVIIPTFNRSDKLPNAINSIINQTYPNIEIIVVDDGSTDDTPKIMEKYKHVDNLKYIRYKENKGVGYARNMGLINAKGKYIAINDSDDISLCNRLEKEYKMIKRFNLLMIGCCIERTHIPVIKLETLFEDREKYSNGKHNIECCKKILGFATFMFDKSVFDTIGIFSIQKSGTDAEFIERFMINYENYTPKRHIHNYLCQHYFGKNYLIVDDIYYYCSEFDDKNITKLNVCTKNIYK